MVEQIGDVVVVYIIDDDEPSWWETIRHLPMNTFIELLNDYDAQPLLPLPEHEFFDDGTQMVIIFNCEKLYLSFVLKYA